MKFNLLEICLKMVVVDGSATNLYLLITSSGLLSVYAVYT